MVHAAFLCFNLNNQWPIGMFYNRQTLPPVIILQPNLSERMDKRVISVSDEQSSKYWTTNSNKLAMKIELNPNEHQERVMADADLYYD